MIVTRERLADVLADLSRGSGPYGLDTETTGLSQTDRFFSIIISTADEKYYFNFNRNAPEPQYILERSTALPPLRDFFANPGIEWDLSNAKFDIRMFAREGIELGGPVHCTQAIERVIYNAYKTYGLDAVAKRRGLEKSSAVDEYIKKFKLTTIKEVPGKKKKLTLKHYDRVPFDVMQPYAENDAHISRVVAADQRRTIAKTENDPDFPSLRFVYENERKLTKTLARVEANGIRIDPDFTQRALEYEMARIEAGRKEFREVTGEEFISSGKALAPIFDRFGVPYLRTDKGNPSFTADWLDELPDTTPLGRLINAIRRPEKRAGTYYSAFLYEATEEDRIHCDQRQEGTETGRLSARGPNLANLPKEDEDEDLAKPYHVRECFIPDEGYFFLDIDWQAIQFRLMVDLAGEMGLLRAIMAGADVHQATADMVGISRKQAKTLNFALLFGAGPAKVAAMLGISLREATALRNVYFARLPKIEQFVRQVAKIGKARGWVFNPFGRRCHITDPEFAFILPCHIIQGSEGDILKLSMNRIHDLLASKKARTKMSLPVHDQILFNMHPNEIELVKPIVSIMEAAYDAFARNGMKLLTSVDHSTTRWGVRNLHPGVPGDERRAS